MVASQNGWKANDRSVVSSRQIPGTNVFLTVHNGPSGDLLLAVAAIFDKTVEDIDVSASFGTPDDWGYAERPIRGGVELSNHASGTAIDLNATRHPLGTEPTRNYSAGQIAAIHLIIAATGGVVRWGGDYIGRKDGMHFEINDAMDEAQCAVALAALQPWVAQVAGGIVPPLPAPAPAPAPQPVPAGDTEQIKKDQFNLNDTGFACGVDGVWGPASQAACRAFQFAAHLAVDGICGPATRAALYKVPSWRGGADGGYPARLWQQKLKDHGWHIAVDGVWGGHSVSILRQFQADKGLGVDGVRGPQSWTCLYCTTN